MLKKLINGIVFGTGFGIAFVVVVVIYFQFFFSPMVERTINSSNEIIGTPPSIKEHKKYLGSPGIYSGDFLDKKGGVLSEGPGQIVGKTTVNNIPVSGLRLRLALNGSVMSQWATTDAEGKYIVSVPYGDYRIDGFELDPTSANLLLAGKIDYPQNAISSAAFEVTRDSIGRGLTLKFVDPVIKKILKNKFSASEDIVLHWDSYPGASQYKLQIYEKADPNDYMGNNTIFRWSNRPSVTSTSFDLKKHGLELKAGHFYVFAVDANDDKMNIISKTADMYTGYDFEVVE